ncbi:MAG: DUF4349 domain-containing protein [Bacteroidia bacterium]|nr:DUF4349 domain-containing protein [Bacteroidia bacterium]
MNMTHGQATYTDFEDQFGRSGGRTDPDKNLIVRFVNETRPDRKKTEETGEPAFRQVEYIHIVIPGDKTLQIYRPVMASDKVRFADQYRAFKEGATGDQSGTPLTSVDFVTEQQRRELQHLNIYTVEHLANALEGNLQTIMGGQSLKRSAQEYLRAKRAADPAIRLQDELAQRDRELEDLKARLAELEGMVAGRKNAK